MKAYYYEYNGMLIQERPLEPPDCWEPEKTEEENIEDEDC